MSFIDETAYEQGYNDAVVMFRTKYESRINMTLEEAAEKQVPKTIKSDGDDESDWCYCPECMELLGDNEWVGELFVMKENIYCSNCGQKLKERVWGA